MDSDEWSYLAEGNANIVVSYKGDNEIYVGFIILITRKAKFYALGRIPIQLTIAIY
jgi:hypothetical protein